MHATDAADDTPITPPTRKPPTPQLATARQKTDGTVVTDGPGPIQDSEVSPPKRWVAKVPLKERGAAIDAAVQDLRDLKPPASSTADYVAERLGVRGLGISSWAKCDVLVLAYAPGLDVSAYARALASAFFRVPKAHAVFDCCLPENGDDDLFGTPPGYKGCLEGGHITNRLRLQPESVIVLDNVEYADDGTLAHMQGFARDGKNTLLVARGAQVIGLEPVDAVFVLATKRAFPTVAAKVGDDAGGAFDALLTSMKKGRPDLDWDTDEDAFVYGNFHTWGDPVASKG